MKTRISFNATVNPANGLIVTQAQKRRHGTVLGFAWHGLDGCMGCGNVVAIVLEDRREQNHPVLVPVRQADFGLVEEQA